MSWLDKITVPSLEADQRILDASLMVFGHVLMHIWIVLPDVAFGAAVGNRPEAKRRGIGVRTLELQWDKGGKTETDYLKREVKGGDRGTKEEKIKTNKLKDEEQEGETTRAEEGGEERESK